MAADFSWNEVGERVRQRREDRGLSQRDLAAAAELTQGGVLAIEKGATNPQLGTLQKIAAELGCSVRALVCGEAGPAPAKLDGILHRVRRVHESGDEDAVAALESGLAAAEALLHRRRPSPRASYSATGLLKRTLEHLPPEALPITGMVKRILRGSQLGTGAVIRPSPTRATATRKTQSDLGQRKTTTNKQAQMEAPHDERG